MKRKPFLTDFKRLLILLLFYASIFLLFQASQVSVFAQQTSGTTDSTDLSTMDWSDEPEESAETDLSTMDWSDEPTETESVDFANESWDDGPSEGTSGSDSLSEESWNEDGETGGFEELDFTEIEKKERKIHFYGFLLFMAYLLGMVLTAYLTRNRKLAIDYPPELLMVLHTLWPLELALLLVAGKRVR